MDKIVIVSGKKTTAGDEPARLNEAIQVMYATGGLVAMSADLVRWTENLRRSLGDKVEL